MKKRDGDGFFRNSDELNHAIFRSLLSRWPPLTTAVFFWTGRRFDPKLTGTAVLLAALFFCPRRGADDGLLTAIVSRESDKPTASTGCCDDKIMLRRGILRPTDPSLLSVLSFWHAIDAASV